MIGQLINQFDNLPENENTVAKFNELFSLNLLEEPSKILDIGNMVTGGGREIFIDGNMQILHIKDRQRLTFKKPYQGKYKYEVLKEGKVIRVVNRVLDLIEFIDMSDTTIAMYLGKGRTEFNDITVNKVNNIDYK